MKPHLVGVDGSECGDRAVQAAREHAAPSGAELILCFVIPWSPFTFSTPEENAERHRRREEELAVANEQVLNPRLARLRAAGIEARGVVRHGHPAKTLSALAGELGVGMIVIGRAGDTPLKTHIFGGTAAALVQIAPCPVLVVP